ncbi:aldo/keto reductase [Peribacillus sp. SCS-155]|uniref:aldo/keto reductase n=1 Tax=Peribacillus sedimenti TaxID=3115297 RepID=UPI0039066BDA
MIYRTLGGTKEKIPVIGQGTFKFGEDKGQAKREIEALRFGIENGMTLIDTAEGYADGGAERIVGEAISDVRKDVFLVTKVLRKNCTYEGILQSAEASLKRLNTTYIDLYLQHWPNPDIPLEETMRGFTELLRTGMARHIGVSNFSPELLQEAQSYLGDHKIVCNQIGYHLNDRTIELSLVPYCTEHNVTIMGYSPFGYAPQLFGNKGFPEQGTKERKILDAIACKYGKTAYQVALNWILRLPGLVTIPKASSLSHMKENLQALGWELDAEDVALIEAAFPVK